jgi:hypothetical protein
MEKTINKPAPKNKLGIVFGHKLNDMAEAITLLESKGYEAWVITWDRYSDRFVHTTYTQPTPESQGMDCMNLVLKSAELMFEKTKGRKIGAIANCHTIPTLWDFDLSLSQWKELFDFHNHKDYVNDVVQRRYKELYGAEDTNI